VVNTVTALQARQSRVQIPVEARGVSLFINVQTICGAHPASYSLSTKVLSWGWSSQGVTITTYLHLVLRLRMTGSVPLLPCMLSWCGQGPLYLLLWLWLTMSKKN